MTKVSPTQPLEMSYINGGYCYTVRPSEGSSIRYVRYPSDDRIIQLWQETTDDMDGYIRRSPLRPEAISFDLGVMGSIPMRKRQRFVERLAMECTFIQARFTSREFETVTQFLSQSPLYQIGTEMSAEFVPKHMAAVYLVDATKSLQDTVLEIIGSKLQTRRITEAERAEIMQLVTAISHDDE